MQKCRPYLSPIIAMGIQIIMWFICNYGALHKNVYIKRKIHERKHVLENDQIHYLSLPKHTSTKVKCCTPVCVFLR